MFSPIVRTARHCLPGALVLAIAGCTTVPEINYTTTTSYGQRVTFHMVNGRIDNASAEGIELGVPQLQPDLKEHKVYYDVRLFDQGSRPLRSIRVEDVSDEKAFLLADDEAPKLVAGRWEFRSPMFQLSDDTMKWLTYLDNSFRVYRFTIVFADGHTVVLHELTMIPGYAKSIMRHTLGEKY